MTSRFATRAAVARLRCGYNPLRRRVHLRSSDRQGGKYLATQPLLSATGEWLEGLDVSLAALWRDDAIAPLFARMRAEDPVHHCPDSPFGPYWSITRHADIMWVELRPALFSSSWRYGGITIFGEEGSPAEEQLPMFIAMDRAEHSGARRAVAPGLTPSEMVRLSAALRQRTEALIDGLPIGEIFDWVDRVSIEMTTGMLATLFDFPWEERRKLTYWSDWAGDIEAARDPLLGPRRMKILSECGRRFMRLRRERRQAGEASDLVSRMVHSEAMRDMSPREFLGNLVLLIIGGNDTTRNTISALPVVNGLFPEEWARMARDSTLVANGAQELVRWQTPLAHMRRTATADVEMGGKTIRAGEKVVLWYYSANRDEELFADADRFDVGRRNARRHLAFGAGVHRCLGARLAQLQVATLVETLLGRGLKPVQAGIGERVASSFVHGYRRLPVKLVR